MRISYQWIKEILGADLDIETLGERLTAAGLEVEGIERAGTNLAPIKVAKVLGSRPHPSSKHPLTLVSIDIGTGEPIEVVCGAPNVPPPGGRVIYAPVGAQLFDRKGQPFTVEARTIAGTISPGMLCAEDELGLGPDHSGIVVLPDGEPGQLLLSYLPTLQDWILQLNVTPNRPDALGHLGVAREVAALFGLPFRLPRPSTPVRSVPARPEDSFTVRIEDPERCPRYCAALVYNVKVGPSPLWLRVRLHRLGVRPINNVVDVTNLVMLEYGQPLHAFDVNTLAERTVVVRRARQGETLQTLDGVTRTLVQDDLVIADARHPVALAGVMGAEGSGIQSTTNKVLLESAFFEPRGIRRTARRHGLHTEASHRFEREVDFSAVPHALARAVARLTELAEGVAVGEPIDQCPRPRAPRSVSLRYARIEQVLGTEVPVTLVQEILTALGFERRSTAHPGEEMLLVPLHRPDVTREIDVIEEIGRVFGYDKIPGRLPPVSGARAGVKRDFAFRRRVRQVCASLGLDEAISYAYLSVRDLELAGFDELPRARILNPLSEDRAILRPALLPRLLGAVAHARRHGEPKVRLFEVGTVFSPEGAQEPGLLNERTHLAAVLSGPRDSYLTRPDDVDFYDGKGFVEALVEALCNTAPQFHADAPPPRWAHPRKYAHVTLEGMALGTVAEIHPDVREAMDLQRAVVAIELEAAPLAAVYKTPVARVPSRFPTVRRDVALLVDRSRPAGAIAAMLREHAGAYCEKVELFDRYQGPELPAGTHSLAFALWFRSTERTLTDEEVDTWVRTAVARVTEAFGARQR